MPETVEVNLQELRRLREKVRAVEERVENIEDNLTEQIADLAGILEGEDASSLRQAYISAVSAAQEIQDVKVTIAATLGAMQTTIDQISSATGDYAISQLGSQISDIEDDLATIRSQLSTIQFKTADLTNRVNARNSEYTYTRQTGDYDLLTTDTIAVYSTPAVTADWNLPSRSLITVGKMYMIINQGGVITLRADGSDTMNGSTSAQSLPADSLTVIFADQSSTDWRINVNRS